MSRICPTVMPSSDDPHDFRNMMDRIGSLSNRIQIDLMDGDFAPHRNIEPSKIWWPEGKKADIHLMYRYPAEQIDAISGLRPNMIILHAEADGDLFELMGRIKEAGILAGIGLLKPTTVSSVRHLIEQADHVLLFAGELGSDGTAELSVLDKVPQIREINAMVEIGWDGGANELTVTQLANSGIDVINVGGALRHADKPVDVYNHLVSLIA